MLVSRTKTLRFGSFVKFCCTRGMTDLTYQKFDRPLLCAMNTFHTLPFETRLSYSISFSVVRTIRRALLMCLGLSSEWHRTSMEYSPTGFCRLHPQSQVPPGWNVCPETMSGRRRGGGGGAATP
jgi:hypothetical protein